MSTKTNLNTDIDLNSSVCYPRLIFIIFIIIVLTVILMKLLHGSIWLRKHWNTKTDSDSEKVFNLLQKLIKLNNSLERPSHKTFQLLVALMHLLKDKSLSNRNIFHVLKKISLNKEKSFKLWKVTNGLDNIGNAKSVLNQLSEIDPYVNLLKRLRNFNYSQIKESHDTHISSAPVTSNLKKRPKSKVFTVTRYNFKKSNGSQKILKQIHKLHSHRINDSDHGNTVSTSAHSNKSDIIFNATTIKVIDMQGVALHESRTHTPEKGSANTTPSWLISSGNIFDSWTDSCSDEAGVFNDAEEEDLDIETYMPFNKTAFNIVFLSHPSMFPFAAAARVLKLFLQVTFFLAVAFLLLIIIAFAEVREVHGYLYIKDRIAGLDTFQSVLNVFGSSQEAARESSSLHLHSPSSSCSSLVSLRSVLEDTSQPGADLIWRDRMFLLADDRRLHDLST